MATSSATTQQNPLARDFLAGKSRIRISDLAQAKRMREKFVMLTSYDTVSAKIFDLAKIPVLLIGDSAANTVFGYDSTIPVTVDELIPLAKAVSASCERALVIADLPFGSYQESPELALRTAVRFMKEARVHGVKLEGGEEYVKHVKLLTQSGIPVMAHLGFTPQSEHVLGGFKVQGRYAFAEDIMIKSALELQDAGAFACVLELVPPHVGKNITDRLRIPTIGIGAGPDCDGQVLVWHDMAGFSKPQGVGYLNGVEESGDSDALKLNRVPKFVKRYANMSEVLFQAALSFAKDVSSGVYPGPEHCYK